MPTSDHKEPDLMAALKASLNRCDCSTCICSGVPGSEAADGEMACVTCGHVLRNELEPRR